MTYVPLTVGRLATATFTVSGHPGYTVDGLLLNEDGTALLTWLLTL